jgi:PAS domain-containing protein
MSSNTLKHLIQTRHGRAPESVLSTGFGSAAGDLVDTLAVVVEHTPVAIAMFDREMRYILANRQWVKEFNLHQALPLVGKSQYEVFPKLHPGWKQLYERALQGYTMRSDHAVQGSAGAAPVLFRCEARPWRQKLDASVAGIVVTCNKFLGPATTETDSATAPERNRGVNGASGAGLGVRDAAMTGAGELDVSAAELPVFVLDNSGRVLAANTSAAELSLARGLEVGKTLLWEVLEDEARRPTMKQVFEDSVARMNEGSGVPPQILIVKSPSQGSGGDAGGRSLPCRWLLARHGTAGGRWLALGLSGLTPFEAVARVGIQLPPATVTTGLEGFAPRVLPRVSEREDEALEMLRRERDELQTELSQTQEALRLARAEVRMLRDAEQTLLRREQQQHSVVEAMPAGLLVLDEAGRPLQQNTTLKKLLGHEIRGDEMVETWLGRSCPTAEHRNEVSRIWREDVWRRQLTRTVSLVTSDGLLKEIEMRPALLAHNGLLVHFQDVTAACRLEEQLSATESKLRVMLQENPLPVLLTDKLGVIYDANRAAETLFEKSKAELRRLPVEALLAPEGVVARKDALREMRQSGETRGRVTVPLAGTGAPRMHLSMAPIRAADGGTHSTVHFFEAPLGWTQPAASPAERSPAAIPTVRPGAGGRVLLLGTGVNGRIQTWTAEAAALFGEPPATAVGRSLHELFQPSDASKFYGVTLPAALASGKVQWTFFSRDGEKRNAIFEMHAGPTGGAQVEVWQILAPEPDLLEGELQDV